MAKYNFELKKKIVLEHLSLGVGSKALAKKYNVKSARQIRQWIHNYNEFGEEGLKEVDRRIIILLNSSFIW